MMGAASVCGPRHVAIVDPCCGAGYSPASLAQGGLGGTEATVLRIAAALSAKGKMSHFQKHRDHPETTDAGQMRPLSDAFLPNVAQTFVVINSWKVACKLRKHHPQARIFLWLHIHPGRHNRPMAAALALANITVICVSKSHAAHMRAFLGNPATLCLDYIYNPIADDLFPDATPRDPNRLLFASAPHKGLAQVFAQFQAARAEIPDLTLAVADPGYLAWDTGPVPDGVTFLGTLPHDALIAEMRQAHCLFYPQTTFAETFGLVLAEANAVGLPVLVHRDLGANAEIVGDLDQCINGHDLSHILARLRQWRATPPLTRANPEFRLSNVARRWAEILGLDAASSDPFRKVA